MVTVWWCSVISMSEPMNFTSLVLAANGSSPAPAPMPDDTEDVVEAYSFNTGRHLPLATFSCIVHPVSELRL